MEFKKASKIKSGLKKALACLGLAAIVTTGCATTSTAVPSNSQDNSITTQYRKATPEQKKQIVQNLNLYSTYGKIDLINIVKAYTEQEWGFKRAEIYKDYVATPQKVEVSYELAICEPFHISNIVNKYIHLSTPQQYRKPIKDCVLIFSGKDNLRDEEQYYSSLDTYWRKSENFSSQTSITPEFLSRTPADIVDTIIHEAYHANTKKHKGKFPDRELEEAAATAYGFMGGVKFTESFFGKDSKHYKDALKEFNAWAKYSNYINKYARELKNLYWQPISPAQKRIKKSLIIASSVMQGREVNNAKLWYQAQYTRNFFRMLDFIQNQPDMKSAFKILMNMPNEEEKGLWYITKHTVDAIKRQKINR